MGLKRYKATDLTVLLVIMCAIEGLSLFILKRVGSQFYVSVIVPITLIVYMRWGLYGLIHAAVGGLLETVVITYLNGDMTAAIVARSAAVYGFGYLSTAAAMLLFIKGKNFVTGNLWITLLYAFIAFAAMCIGRSVIATTFGENFFEILPEYLTREALNFVFTFIILWIARKQKTFFTDQKEYYFSVRK